jgi:subtilisin family serine protease
MSKCFTVLSALGVLALAACADEPTVPTTPAPSLAVAAGADAASRHFVLFKSQNKVPAGFASRVAALGGKVESAYDAVGAATVLGLSANAVATLRGSSDVASVDQDEAFSVDYRTVPQSEIAAAAGTAVRAADASGPAGAFYFARQWNHRAIGADKAWAAGKRGSSAVRVAILDTGIDYTYPDLAPLVDVDRSASFIPGDDTVATKFFAGKNLKKFVDFNGHGTHVASAVGRGWPA